MILVDQLCAFDLQARVANQPFISACVIVTEKHLGSQPVALPVRAVSGTEACEEDPGRLEPSRYAPEEPCMLDSGDVRDRLEAGDGVNRCGCKRDGDDVRLHELCRRGIDASHFDLTN